jgi:hypothetical protein
VSTFTVEDAFYITGRNWVLAGNLGGEVTSGNRLVAAEAEWLITSVEAINVQGRYKTGFFIAQQLASRHELIEQPIVVVTARIVA